MYHITVTVREINNPGALAVVSKNVQIFDLAMMGADLTELLTDVSSHLHMIRTAPRTPQPEPVQPAPTMDYVKRDAQEKR